MPASFCGICGMKPTHGLVPYTGIMPIEIFVDHTDPMTANVADNALLLEVLAGPDGYDPRQYNVRVQPYTEALGRIAPGEVIYIRDEDSGEKRIYVNGVLDAIKGTVKPATTPAERRAATCRWG